MTHYMKKCPFCGSSPEVSSTNIYTGNSLYKCSGDNAEEYCILNRDRVRFLYEDWENRYEE